MISPLDGRTVLVTGGTGSFGQAFVDYALAECSPRKVIVYSRGEHKQARMRERIDDDRVRFFLGDVRDSKRLHRACRGVDVLIHAAALKRVESAEYDPEETVKTNIGGALNVVHAALEQRVRRVVALSTDKAAAPVTMYGATKLCAEKALIAANAYAGDLATRFACCRYGNVVGSEGSVFQAWPGAERIQVTDPNMTRFWLRMSDAIRLVLFALDNMTGGEVFVPRAPSSDLLTLADALAPDALRTVVGARPGEKLHETLISADESRLTIQHEQGFAILPAFRCWDGDSLAGQPVGRGYEYRSDTNPWRLSAGQLRRWVE